MERETKKAPKTGVSSTNFRARCQDYGFSMFSWCHWECQSWRTNISSQYFT